MHQKASERNILSVSNLETASLEFVLVSKQCLWEKPVNVSLKRLFQAGEGKFLTPCTHCLAHNLVFLILKPSDSYGRPVQY